MLWTECLCPLKIRVLKPYSPSNGIRWRGLQEVMCFTRVHEGGALMNGISVLITRTDSLCVIHCESKNHKRTCFLSLLSATERYKK